MAVCQKLDPKTGRIWGSDSLIKDAEGQNSSRLALVDVFGDGYSQLTILSFSVSFKPI
jgi:hypothetical protein